MIFFDLDNTLLDHDGAEQNAIEAFAANHPGELVAGTEAIGKAWRDISDSQRARWRAGELDFEQLRRARISALFQRPLTVREADSLMAEYYALYRQHWRLFPDVLPALEALKAVAPMAIITNGFAYHQEAKLKQMAIRDYFQFMVISEQVGHAKPHPNIFRQALRQSGLSAEQCWYIGNHPDNDATAASQLGFKAVWLNRHYQDTPSPSVQVNTRVVRTLGGFVELVKMNG